MSPTGARGLLLRGEAAALGVIAPVVVAADGTARLLTGAPAPVGAHLALALGWPPLLPPLEVTADVVGAEAAGAPGDRSAWLLALTPGAGTDAVRALVASVGATPPPAARARVLLVEDSALLCDAFRWGLRRHLGAHADAVTVDAVGDVDAAWALTRAHRYDLIVVDYFLPGQPGDALIARLRAAAAPAPPVVAVSLGGEVARDATMAAGADLFLAKPLALAELYSTLDLCLAKGVPIVPKRILLMDDSVLFLELVSDALRRAGYQVTTARDLGELDGRPDDVDLVLMDVQMPEAFGDDLGMVLRHVRGSAAAIYLLSSLDGDELARRAAEAGLDGYISKHVGVDAVVARVGEITAALPEPA
ncbi:MAG: response regulator transcription factor [Myxococcales bacterium]|nr:response regulator transcription factor [Myxococcales bacterium]